MQRGSVDTGGAPLSAEPQGVGRVGVEPTRVSPVDFKSTASAIPPPARKVNSNHFEEQVKD